MTKRTGFWYRHFAKGPTRKTSAPPPLRFSPWLGPLVTPATTTIPDPVAPLSLSSSTACRPPSTTAKSKPQRSATSTMQQRKPPSSGELERHQKSNPNSNTLTAPGPSGERCLCLQLLLQNLEPIPLPAARNRGRIHHACREGTERQRNQRQSQVFLVPQSHFSAAAVV